MLFEGIFQKKEIAMKIKNISYILLILNYLSIIDLFSMECNKDKQQPKTFETLREYCKETLFLPLKYKNIIQYFKDFSPVEKQSKK